jgi:hypothetical protein
MGRDFLASLSRIIQMNDSYFRRMFENDKLSKANLTKELDVYSLCEFNTINIQCMLPRIDQGLMHAPALRGQDMASDMSVSYFNNNHENEPGVSRKRKQRISEEVVKALSQQLLKEKNVQVKEVIAGVLG